ncbi:hypothetical protein ACFYNY_23575 [Streptomyces sp. NPDC006530]|uniref:hypothetical protein n=1 Tax=Streptomyces sp. NPDC006530 TaxID=3364750 RepID=UPI0036D02743
MQNIAQDGEANPSSGWRIASGYSNKMNIQDSWREFAEDILQPFFDYLSERVDAESSILHTLERYRTRIERFDREELYTRFEADRANGEEVYNLDLQRFLFLEGDHITHAKPPSASGEADLIGDLDSRDSLVCDGKIFDGKGHDKGYLGKGLHQVVKYAHDYGQHTAYLVIYNISDKLLELPTDGTPEAWPPYTDVSGVRVYFIHVRNTRVNHSPGRDLLRAQRRGDLLTGCDRSTLPDRIRCCQPVGASAAPPARTASSVRSCRARRPAADTGWGLPVRVYHSSASVYWMREWTRPSASRLVVRVRSPVMTPTSSVIAPPGPAVTRVVWCSAAAPPESGCGVSFMCVLLPRGRPGPYQAAPVVITVKQGRRTASPSAWPSPGR